MTPTWEEVFDGKYKVKSGPLESECWVWTKGTCVGYGWMRNIFRTDEDPRPQDYAHRISYQLHTGHRPKEIRHHCDVKLCIRPLHIEDGTHADNMRDVRLRRRARLGSDRANSKLTEDVIREAFRRRVEGETWAQIARSLDVPTPALHHAGRGATWCHVDSPHRDAVQALAAANVARRLTREGVAQIKRAILNGMSNDELVETFDIHPRTAYDIRRGKAHPQVEPADA